MKRVLIISNTLEPGGAERQLFYLAKTLAGSGYSVSFYVYDKKGLFASELNREGIPIIVAKRKSFWKSSRDLRIFVRKGGYDVVVSYLPECNLISEFATLPVKRWRVIVGARSANPAFLTNPRLRLYYYAHLLADLVISNSETNKSDILKVNKLLRGEKVHVVYNMFVPPIRDYYYQPFTNSKINIVVAANYRKVKNLDGVLNALIMLGREQQAKIHIDWYGLEIEESLSEGLLCIQKNHLEDVITLHASSDSISEVYSKSDVVGLFSHYEGLPNSLCEALVLGKMIICTPVSDMPHLLKGTRNIVMRGFSSDGIREGFERLINTPRECIISTGKDNAERFTPVFSIDNIKQQLLSCF